MSRVGRKARQVVGKLLTDLAAGRYDEVVADGRATRIAIEGLLRTLDELGARINPDAVEAARHLRVRQADLCPGECLVEAPLWTIGSRQELFLVLTVRNVASGVNVEMTDLRVAE
jgi:hypothetical protein